MAIELPDARHLSDEALQGLRLRALHGLELGYSEGELADLLGLRQETISRWWTAYRAEGLRSLPGGRTGRPLGSGRLLSEQQAERIKSRIDHNSPEEVVIAHALWTRRAVRDLIRPECGLDLAERPGGQLLGRGGQQEGPADRGPAAGAQDAAGAGLAGGAPGPDRGLLPAGLRAGVEPRGVPEQRPEGRGERGWPARQQGDVAGAHPGLYGPVGQRAETGNQLLSASLGPTRCPG